jgi:hypothetical protein
VHFNERPFLCDGCGQTFHYRRDCNIHVVKCIKKKQMFNPWINVLFLWNKINIFLWHLVFSFF